MREEESVAERTQPPVAGEIQQPLEVSQSSQAEGDVDHNPTKDLPPPVLAIPNQPPTNSHQKQTCCKKSNALDICRFIVELGTLGVLFWYTIITRDLWRVANQANRLNIENARLDQRAWVGVMKPLAPDLRVGGKTFFGVTLVNSGKTPARKALFYVVARPVREGESLTISYPTSPSQKSVAILSPQIPISIYDPNVTRTFIDTEVEDIKNKRMTVYLFGKVSYEDVAYQAHCLTFCYWLSPDLRISNTCEMYNEETDIACGE